jgi:thiol-disulfide isomerase/thioredoxin
VVVPDPPKRPNGTIDSTFQLRWLREHFFDHLDLGDEAMTRLPQPVYKQKVDEYLDKLYAPQPDTVFKAVQKIMAKAKKNTETYKYLAWLMVLKYQQPEIMGLDEVFVKLYDKYFATGEMDYWANASMKKNLKDHADRLRKSLVGQIGHNLIMQDSNLKRQSMYDIKNKYTLLFIFDPECGHCRKETPVLVDFYTKNKTKFNLEVFAVSADSSMAKMKAFIKEFNTKWITVNGPRSFVGSYHDYYDAMTTPSLYILDEKKKIIAKKIPVEKIEEFLINYENFLKKSKAAPKL